MLGQVLADLAGEGQAQVAVNVDLADGHAGSLAQHFLGHALRAGHVAAVLVDHVHIAGDDAAGAMQHDGEAGQALGDFLQNVEAQMRLALKLEGAVAGADGDGQAVAAGTGGELLDLFGAGVAGVLGGDLHVVLDAGQAAQLGLDGHVAVVRILDDLAGQGDVLLKGQVAAVDHDAGEAAVDAALAGLKVGAMVQMHHDGQIGVLNGGLDHLHEVDVLGILARARAHLQNEGGIFHLGALGDALDDFHVVDVEGADGVTALVSLFEHLFAVDHWHG